MCDCTRALRDKQTSGDVFFRRGRPRAPRIGWKMDYEMSGYCGERLVYVIALVAREAVMTGKHNNIEGRRCFDG